MSAKETWTPCRYEERSDSDGSWEVCVTHDMLAPCEVDVIASQLRTLQEQAPTPIRPYRPGTPLVAVSKSAWEEARQAECAIPELEDALANANAYAEHVWDLIADFLLSYSGDGDTSDPQSWQSGHNYAMREAARMVRERWPETVGNPLTTPAPRLGGEREGEGLS